MNERHGDRIMTILRLLGAVLSLALAALTGFAAIDPLRFLCDLLCSSEDKMIAGKMIYKPATPQIQDNHGLHFRAISPEPESAVALNPRGGLFFVIREE